MEDGPPFRVVMRAGTLPDDLVLEVILPEDPVEHHLDVMAGVPVAVIVETAGLLQDAMEFHATRNHEVDVGSRRFVPILEGPLLLRRPPEDLVIAIRVEWRIDVDEVDR